MLNLPANFETYAEARKSGFMKMKSKTMAAVSWVFTALLFLRNF